MNISIINQTTYAYYFAGMLRGKFFDNAFDGSDLVKDQEQEGNKAEANPSKKTQKASVSFSGLDLDALKKRKTKTTW